MTENGEVSAVSIDFEHHQLICPDGMRLTLQPISKLILERLYNDQSGKPKVPIVEVTIAGTHQAKQANPDDPAYIQALDAWQSTKNIGLARYLIVHGIVELPPDQFSDEYRGYAPQMSEADLKYLWVLSLFGEDDESQTNGVRLLSEAIVGQTAPTAKGIELATNTFPGDGKRKSDHAVSPRKTANSRDVQSAIRGISGMGSDGLDPE